MHAVMCAVRAREQRVRERKRERAQHADGSAAQANRTADSFCAAARRVRGDLELDEALDAADDAREAREPPRLDPRSRYEWAAL